MGSLALSVLKSVGCSSEVVKSVFSACHFPCILSSLTQLYIWASSSMHQAFIKAVGNVYLCALWNPNAFYSYFHPISAFAMNGTV